MVGVTQYLLMLTRLWKLKKDFLFYLSDAYAWSPYFWCSHQMVLFEMGVFQTSAKEFSVSKTPLGLQLYQTSFQILSDITFSNSRPKMFCNEVVLSNNAKVTEKHLRRNFLLKSDTGIILWILLIFSEHPFPE